jgi:hypothetical protein
MVVRRETVPQLFLAYRPSAARRAMCFNPRADVKALLWGENEDACMRDPTAAAARADAAGWQSAGQEYPGGGGLYLHVAAGADGTDSPLVAVPVRCVFRKLSTRTAKRGKLNAGMGLGPLADVSLAGAMSNQQPLVIQ